jgi:hypothetical protein
LGAKQVGKMAFFLIKNQGEKIMKNRQNRIVDAGLLSYLRTVSPAQRPAAASDVPQPNLDVPQGAKKIRPAASPQCD